MEEIKIVISFVFIALVSLLSAPRGLALVPGQVASSATQTPNAPGKNRSSRKQGDELEGASAGQSERNLRLASEAADHITDRLLETLDFTEVWKEMFVSDPAIRDKAIMDFWADSGGSKSAEKFRDIDQSSLLRGYLAFHNTFTLGLAAMMRATSLEKPESLDESTLFAGVRDLPEFEAARNAPYGLAEMRSNLTPEQFKEVFNKTIPQLERLIPIMRAHLLEHPGEPGVYTSNVSYLKGLRVFTHPEILKGLAESGIPEDNDVYVVEALFFRLYFIQTDAGLKLIRIETTFD
jgi:hypothetical protein